MNFKKKVSGSWTDTPHYIHNTSTDTITTLPAVIHPTGTTATVGLKGNTLQSSILSPTSPVMPQGTGERTGNLLPSPALETKSNNGITVRSDGAGRYYVSGTAENDAYITFNIPPFLIPISVGLNGNGTFSIFNTKTYQNAAVKLEFYYQGTLVDNWGLINLNRTSTNYSVMANRTTDTVGIFVKSGTTVDFQISPEFTNDGVLPSEYEPYGYKIPILSANTTTPVYLGEVETTRKIVKYEFTGQENWYVEGSDIFYTDPITEAVRYAPICSHFFGVDTLSGNNQVTISQSLRINIKTNGITHTASDFKTYLQQQYATGTPVTVWYVLATPETGTVNEPLRKIGDYADEVSGITIPTITGKDTFDVLTTLKPSEVELTYTGWHDATVKESDGSDWQ